jgi:prepilin-type N-terminal cleavage/methylation domain-containing protein
MHATMRPARAGQRGFTLLEMAITIAIIGILAAIGATLLTETIPSWRTRRASKEFASALNECRQLAIAQGVQYRVRLATFDADLDGTGPSTGSYYIERGNAAVGSTTWDILPWDMDGSGTMAGEGTVVLTEGGEDAQKGVSIEQWATLTGVDGDDIVFSPRGWLDNPATDFDRDGYIEVTFVNKVARAKGAQDEWTAMVSRGGLVRLESNRTTATGASSGTPSSSQWTTSSSTGYAP